MFEVSVLASGSSGNSLLVSRKGRHFLVDAGISARRLCRRLAECGVDPDSLEGVVLTHEHSDHAGGVRVLCGGRDLPVYTSRPTADTLCLDARFRKLGWKLFEAGSVFSLAGMEIDVFSVPHDASDPVGLVVRDSGSAMCVLTDLGYATRAILDRLRDIDALLIEANHDEALLARDTRRPWAVKQRILSRHGHLSNKAAAEIVRHGAELRLSQVILGHLSRDCNHADLAVRTVSDHLNGHAPESLSLVAIEQDAPIHHARVGHGEARAAASRVMETGDLFSHSSGRPG